MKEQCPVILPPDEKGNTQINPLYASVMHQITIGTFPEEMGLTQADIHRFVDILRRDGVDFPQTNDWFGTQYERRILHAFDEGATTYPALEIATGIGYESLKVYAHAIKKPRKGRREEGIPFQVARSKRRKY